MNHASITELIDQYLELDGKIKRLELERDAKKEQVIALGEGAHRSNLGSVSVTAGQRRTLDQELLKSTMGADLEAFYKVSKSITVRVTHFNRDEEA